MKGEDVSAEFLIIAGTLFLILGGLYLLNRDVDRHAKRLSSLESGAMQLHTRVEDVFDHVVKARHELEERIDNVDQAVFSLAERFNAMRDKNKTDDTALMWRVDAIEKALAQGMVEKVYESVRKKADLKGPAKQLKKALGRGYPTVEKEQKRPSK